MKPGKEQAQRAVAADFGRVLHGCVDRFLAAVESGNPDALETWRRDLEAAFDALAVAAHALHPLAAVDAHQLRKRLHDVMGPATNLARLARSTRADERAAASVARIA